MPLRDPGVYLEDLEHYSAAAVRFTSGLSLEQYLADEMTRAAVERVNTPSQRPSQFRLMKNWDSRSYQFKASADRCGPVYWTL